MLAVQYTCGRYHIQKWRFNNSFPKQLVRNAIFGDYSRVYCMIFPGKKPFCALPPCFITSTCVRSALKQICAISGVLYRSFHCLIITCRFFRFFTHSVERRARGFCTGWNIAQHVHTEAEKVKNRRWAQGPYGTTSTTINAEKTMANDGRR